MGEVFPLTRGGERADSDWQERALCAQTDPEAFFPEKGGSTREAKKVCIGCDVRASASSTRWRTTSGSASGAACRERERRQLKKRAV